MDKFDADKIIKSMVEYAKKDEKEYKKRAENYINNLDLKRLAEIKKKPLKEIQEEDLKFMGFYKASRNEDNLYAYENLDGGKIYFERTDNGFEKRGFRLKKLSNISTVEELIEHSLIDWRLKLNREPIDWEKWFNDIKNREIPF